MWRSFKFRIYPNRNQLRELEIALESHRRLYNSCLAQRKDAYSSEKIAITYNDQSAWFKSERQINPFFARLNFSSAQVTMRRLDKAFRAFFRRVKAGEKPGYPRFRGRDRYDSIEYATHGDGIRLTGNRLRVQHVGTIRVKLHRKVSGTVKTVTLKRTADKWYVILLCDLGDIVAEPSVNPAVGIDVGLKSFLKTSDGQSEPNPRYLKTALPELRRKSRSVCRKKKGGKNRRKAAKKLAKVHAKIKNLRSEHHHQVALKLVRRYGFIAVERLNIQGMLKSGRLTRAISDVAWGNFLLTLKCKAEGAGISVVEVNPRGTTQQCSGCGETVPKDLSVRWHDCPHCGLSLDRDENAARNILARGLLARTEPAGGKGQPAFSREAVSFN